MPGGYQILKKYIFLSENSIKHQPKEQKHSVPSCDLALDYNLGQLLLDGRRTFISCK